MMALAVFGRIPLQAYLQSVFMPCRNWPIILLVSVIAPLPDGSEYKHASEPAYGSIFNYNCRLLSVQGIQTQG